MDSEYTRLTVQDIEVLLDALKAWESKDLAGDLLVTMLAGLGSADTPEGRAQAERKVDERMSKSESESRRRKETSVILQAKLIQMRQKITADSLIESAGLS